MSLHYTLHRPSEPSSLSTLAVLVHGGALSGRMYRTLIPHLTVTSIAVDLPGHGQSASLGPFSFSTSTTLINDLINTLSSTYSHIILVGISLGGQVVLDFLSHHPTLVSSAIVSGVSIHAPDDRAGWEMPHMPVDKEWIDMMMEDVGIVGMDAAGEIQKQSLAFTFHGTFTGPPVLVCRGEHDVAMARRDFEELVTEVRRTNEQSEGVVLDGAWHNHSIDVPEEFAKVASRWIIKMS